MELMTRRNLLLRTDSALPPGYKRVEYIEATQLAYIQTDYVPTQNDEVYVRYMPTAITDRMKCLFSAGNGTYQLIALGTEVSGTQAYYCKYFASGGAKILSAQNVANNWVTMRVTANGDFISNGVETTSPYESALDGSNTNLFIFRRANTNYPFIGRLASFRISNSGTKKLELIPCVRLHDNISGAYDTVSRRFYSSASPNEEFSHG